MKENVRRAGKPGCSEGMNHRHMSGRHVLGFCPGAVRPEMKQTVVRRRDSGCAVDHQHGANAVPERISPWNGRIQYNVRPRGAVIIADR